MARQMKLEGLPVAAIARITGLAAAAVAKL
jgi:hypothetical protein